MVYPIRRGNRDFSSRFEPPQAYLYLIGFMKGDAIATYEGVKVLDRGISFPSGLFRRWERDKSFEWHVGSGYYDI
jgi:hypothetical protein